LIAGEEIEVRVRESQRARTTRLIVGPRRPLEVIVPARVRAAEIDRFLASKRTWIERKLAQVREINSRPQQLGLDQPGVRSRLARRRGARYRETERATIIRRPA